jgi:hypothetical protein
MKNFSNTKLNAAWIVLAAGGIGEVVGGWLVGK